MVDDAIGEKRLIELDEGGDVGTGNILGGNDGEFAPGDAGVEVDALASELISLRAQHSTTNAALFDTGAEIGESTVAAAEAVKASKAAQVDQEAIRTKLSPEAEAKVTEIVAKANATEKAYAIADAERLKLLGQKTALISIAVLAMVGGLALRFYKP